MHISIVLGTARKERKSERVFKVLGDAFMQRAQTEVEMVDVRDHVVIPETIPSWGVGGADEVPSQWQAIVRRTDVFIFVLPEYNHSYPGEWKLLIDSLGSEYSRKRAHVVGVSAGAFGGVRVADHVRPILVELDFDLRKKALHVGRVGDTISADGSIQDEQFRERLNTFVDDVVSSA